MRGGHAVETLVTRALMAGVRALPWRASLKLGEALGDLVRAAGLRRAVAEANLARAFPEADVDARRSILVAHYRELGRVACEYARLPELVEAAPGEVVAEVRGMEHLMAAREAGRGAILLTGHFGSFELLGAYLGRSHPLDFVVQPMSNAGLNDLVSELRRRAGVGVIPLGTGIRRVFAALSENRWIAMVADQDARDRGVFVPFFGHSSSTPAGPAQIALRTGAPIVMGFPLRREDGRHELALQAPLAIPAAGDPRAVEILTARHTACLEAWVRRYPAMWFWLHRRWKTSPPATPEA